MMINNIRIDKSKHIVQLKEMKKRARLCCIGKNYNKDFCVMKFVLITVI